jgi:hypothetical protein
MRRGLFSTCGDAVRRVAVVLLLTATSAPAQAQNDHACHDGHISSDLAVLRPGVISSKEPRSHFYEGADTRAGCPGAGPTCRRNGYVLRGDKVIVAEERVPGFVCAAFVDRKGEITAGWLPEATVDIRPPAQPSLANWLGRWRYGNSNITIKRGKAPGTFDVEGDSWSKRYQSVNEGVISGEAVKPNGNIIAFADDAGTTVPYEKANKETDCAIMFALVHDVMVAEDNGNCGGAGVYFSGFYRRKR